MGSPVPGTDRGTAYGVSEGGWAAGATETFISDEDDALPRVRLDRFRRAADAAGLRERLGRDRLDRPRRQRRARRGHRALGRRTAPTGPRCGAARPSSGPWPRRTSHDRADHVRTAAPARRGRGHPRGRPRPTQPGRRGHDRGDHHHPGGRRRGRPGRHDPRAGGDVRRDRQRDRARHHHPRLPRCGARRQRAWPPVRHPRPLARRLAARRLHPRRTDHPRVHPLRQPGQRRGQLPAHRDPLRRQPAVRAVPGALLPRPRRPQPRLGVLRLRRVRRPVQRRAGRPQRGARQHHRPRGRALHPDRGRGQRVHRQRDRRAGADLAAAPGQGHPGRARAAQRAVGQQPAQHRSPRGCWASCPAASASPTSPATTCGSSTTSSPATAAAASAW